MEYLLPLLIVALVIIIGGGVMWGLNRRRQAAAPAGTTDRPDAPRRGREVNAALAQAASVRLNPEQHRTVYSLIARQQPAAAIKAFRVATGAGLMEAATAVAALAQFPQPSPTAQTRVAPPAPPAAESAPRSDTPPVPSPPVAWVAPGPLTVADILSAAPRQDTPTAPGRETPTQKAPAQDTPGQSTPAVAEQPVAEQPVSEQATPVRAYRYRAIVSHGDEVREVASTRLNETIFGTIRALALAGDQTAAVQLLREHADISDADARAFVAFIREDD